MRIHFKLKIYSFQKHFKIVCSTMWGSTVKQLPQELYQVGLLCLNRIQRKQMRWTMTETTCDLLRIRTLIYAYQFLFFKRMLWSMVKNTKVSMALILSQTPMVIVCDCLFSRQISIHWKIYYLFLYIHWFEYPRPVFSHINLNPLQTVILFF